ncbi:MAG: hypothetical protein ABH854_02835 [Candidatus Diapherotrites archaeon]|nr:hypothetical protein [Candidatus Micrarchaeota archaeon]MBU1939658.1 hypothetical protein [Candidatus Micrarchaeota archaeon]
MGEERQDTVQVTTGIVLVIIAVIFVLVATDIIDLEYTLISGEAWGVFLAFAVFAAGLVMVYGGKKL